MTSKIDKIELLAPAGDLEKLKTAVIYGADAVYIGGKNLSLRQKAKNFDDDQLKEGIEFAHRYNKKVYIACNIFAHNQDLDGIADYFLKLSEYKADALIISDPGIFSIAREIIPNMEIHISTQSNSTNFQTARFWHKLGAKRIVLARELSLLEIIEMGQALDNEIEMETFVHGAMCISYSGRCLLSSVMVGTERDANRGACAHPCRYSYHIVEETRPNEYFPIEEDNRGTYIMNSKDLCMIDNIDDLVKSGIKSFKIEGRMKTPYYIATIVKAYRKAIDDYYDNIEKYRENISEYKKLIRKASYRDFTTGFYYDKPSADSQNYEDGGYIREYDFVAIVTNYDPNTGIATLEQRNKFSVNDEIELLCPTGIGFSQIVEQLTDVQGNAIESAPHPKQILKLKVKSSVQKFDMFRKKS